MDYLSLMDAALDAPRTGRGVRAATARSGCEAPDGRLGEASLPRSQRGDNGQRRGVGGGGELRLVAPKGWLIARGCGWAILRLVRCAQVTSGNSSRTLEAMRSISGAERPIQGTEGAVGCGESRKGGGGLRLDARTKTASLAAQRRRNTWPTWLAPRTTAHLHGAGNSARHRGRMQTDEYLKLAEVEDQMWYFRSLHTHVRRELEPALKGNAAVLDAGCGTGGLILRLRAAHPEWRYSGIDFMPLA